MPNHQPQLDRVFHALGDPTRRAVLERLTRSKASTTELAQPFNMALPSFTQHLGILEACGLVTSHKSGRTRLYTLQPETMTKAANWLDNQRDLWNRRLDQLDQFLLNQKDQQP